MKLMELLSEQEEARAEFHMAETETEIDIAIYKISIAELRIGRLIKEAKGEM